MTTDTTKVGTLARKLAAIMKEIGKVPKSGHNSFHKYDYVTENDLVYAVRQKLSEADIFVFTSVENQAVQIVRDDTDPSRIKQSILALVTTRHTFVDGESGEQFSVLSQGQGADVGDKAGYKAITGAMKYFLYKCFMIPTGDDPEADEKTDHRHSEPSPARTTPTPSSRKPAPPSQTDTAGITEWRKYPVPKFIKKFAGLTLGDMPQEDLLYWANNYKPKPFNGVITEKDKELRAALDEAGEEISAGGN